MTNVPTKLTGKDFEQLILEAAKRHEAEGALTMGRYGVQATLIYGLWQPIRSYPDFEGILASGHQFIMEAKAVAGSSLSLQSDHFRGRQFAHLVKRAAFGGSTWLIIHFAARSLARSNQPATTVAVPVSLHIPFWNDYKAEKVATLHRDTAQELGTLIPWITPKGCRKPLPDLLSFLWPSARQTQLSICRVAEPEASAVVMGPSEPAELLPIGCAGDEAAEETDF